MNFKEAAKKFVSSDNSEKDCCDLKDFLGSYFLDWSNPQVKDGLKILQDHTKDYLGENSLGGTGLDYTLAILAQNCRLDDFLKTGEYSVVYKGKPIVAMSGNYQYEANFFFIEDNVVQYIGDNSVEYSRLYNKIKRGLEGIPSGVVLNYGKTIAANKTYLNILINADVENNELIDLKNNELIDLNDLFSFPTLSFECLSRFYEKTSIAEIARRIGKGSIYVVDFQPDSYIKMTKLEKDKLRKWKKDCPCPLKAPQLGYTCLGFHWHRPSTVLLFDQKTGQSMLFGQDEGAYFGVELTDNPQNVDKAYASLTPKAVGKVYRRQGEWFAVSVDKKELPGVKDVAFGYSNGQFYLERDSEDSAKHYLDCDEGFIDKKGTIYAFNPTLRHERNEHRTMNLKGWYSFHKNTAVRSFSVEGVD